MNQWLNTLQAFAGEDTIECTINQKYTRADDLQDGIDYLNGLSGQPTAEAGKCNRVSCSYGAGIYVCSDVSNPILSNKLFESI